VRSDVRHRLKEDRFAAGAKDTYSWAVEHRTNLIGGVVVSSIIIAAALGGYFYGQKREEAAGLELAKAIRTFNAPIVPAGTPPQPGMDETFSSFKDRALAAQKKLQDVSSHYQHTDSGKMARYLTDVARVQAGDTVAAERDLKQVASSRDQDLASLAKMALASIYVSTNREAEALPIYKALIDHPTATVSQFEAQLQLASIYEQQQPQEALKIYQKMQQENSGGPASEIAMSKIAALKH